jgi:hypothetical protein
MKFNKLLFLGIVIILLISLFTFFAFYNNTHTLEGLNNNSTTGVINKRINSGPIPPPNCPIGGWTDTNPEAGGRKFECNGSKYKPTQGYCPGDLQVKYNTCVEKNNKKNK